MNIAKHMEAIFIVALVLLCSLAYVFGGKPSTYHAEASAATMQTVTITAKRLTAAEKERLVQNTGKPATA